MFDEALFLANWQVPDFAEIPFGGDIENGFIMLVTNGEFDPEDRLALALSDEVTPAVLKLLAFDKAHAETQGDIRIAVASNPNTPHETLLMLLNNADRIEWTGYDWLDWENDDWSASIEYVTEFGEDIAVEIIATVSAVAAQNLEERGLGR